MLGAKDAAATLAVTDLERARDFYENTLGLKTFREVPGAILYESGNSMVLVYPSEFAGTNKATAAAFRVDDLDAVMSRLRERGVVFQDYDLPGLKTVDGVATFGDSKGAFFTDSEGNIIGLAQMG